MKSEIEKELNVPNTECLQTIALQLTTAMLDKDAKFCHDQLEDLPLQGLQEDSCLIYRFRPREV